MLSALRDQVEHLIARGHVDQEGLKLVITKAVRKPLELAMHEAGMSQRKIAEEMGVSQATISKDLAEADTKVSNPSPAGDTKVSAQLDLEEFTSEPEPPSPPASATPAAPVQADIEEFTGPAEYHQARHEAFEEAKKQLDKGGVDLAMAVHYLHHLGNMEVGIFRADPRKALAHLTELDEEWGKRALKIAPKLGSLADAQPTRETARPVATPSSGFIRGISVYW
jgi:transcriptional regulator with XRE-family HTH domain